MTDAYRNAITGILLRDPDRPVRLIRAELRHNEIQKLKLKYPSLPEEEIVSKVDDPSPDDIDGVQLPGPSAITKYLNESGVRREIAKRQQTPRDLDIKWSLGSCKDNEIPAAALPQVVSVHRQLLDHAEDRYLTVRCAVWVARLYPLLNPLLEEAYQGQTEQNNFRLKVIASFYSRKEQVDDINGESPLKTHGLDDLFIVNRDVSFTTVFRKWLEVFFPGIYEDAKKSEADVRLKTADHGLGKLTKKEITLFDQFFGLLIESGTDRQKWEETITFVSARPRLTSLVEKWMALSVRQEITERMQARLAR